MTKWTRVFGRPGTGKTEHLIKMAKQYGLGTYVTYNKAMAEGAKLRFQESGDFSDEAIKGIGTMHKLAFVHSGFKKEDELKPADLKPFLESMGLDQPGEGLPDEEGLEGDDLTAKILREDNRARQTMTEPQNIDDYTADMKIFSQRYRDFKRGIEKIDFTDVLEVEASHIAMNPYPSEFIYADEAQDFTPLMWKVLRGWAQEASTIFVAGDDRQKLYGMMGVDDTFVQMKVDSEEILPESYRLPRKIYRMSERLADMMKSTSHETIKCKDEDGTVEETTIQGFIKYANSHRNNNIYYLARTRFTINTYFGVPGIAETLIENGIPFRTINPRHASWSPWDESFVDYMTSLISFEKGGDVSATSAAHFVKQIPSEATTDEKVAVKKGKKKQFIAQIKGKEYVTHNDFTEFFTFTPSMDNLLKTLTPRQIRTIRFYGMKNPPDLDDIRLSVDTIHASKGREAEIVFLDNGITSRVAESLRSDGSDYEDEIKVWYVGITRASQSLFVVDNETQEKYRRHKIDLGWAMHD